MITVEYIQQVPPVDTYRLSYIWTGRILEVSIIQTAFDDETGETYEVVVASDTLDLSTLAPNEEIEEVIWDLQWPPLIEARCDEAGDLYVALLYWGNNTPEPETISEV